MRKRSDDMRKMYRLSTKLRKDEVPIAASLAAKAFADSPCYVEIFPDRKGREAFLAWMFERNFLLRLNDDCFRCTYDGDKLVSFFMFNKPGLTHPSFCDMLRVGLLGGLVFYGLRVIYRLLVTKNWFEDKERVVLGKRSGTMIRLERMTVLPGYQGKGIGTYALSSALEEADEEGLSVILGTQEKRNVKFYKRLGFKVVDECHVNIGKGYVNWTMVREPKAK